MIADPSRCIEQRPVVEQVMTPMGCMMNAQHLAIEYVEGHPQWQLARWRCEKDKPRDDPA
jgi:hypothetical protein